MLKQGRQDDALSAGAQAMGGGSVVSGPWPRKAPAGDRNIDDRGRQASCRACVTQLESFGFLRGDLLEIGCGDGCFLAEARGRCRHLLGIELIPQARETARARGLEVIAGGLEDLPHRAMFDSIVIGRADERRAGLGRLLEQARPRLRPTGHLIVLAPPRASGSTLPCAHALGSAHARQGAARQHLHDDTIDRLVEGSGYRAICRMPVAEARSLSHVLRSWRRVAWPAWLADPLVWRSASSTAIVATRRD